MSSSDLQATQELLVEILTEELPALPFLKEWGNIAHKWEQALAQFHIQAPCELHYTPRRIAIYSRAFPTHTAAQIQEFFGPPLAIAFIDGDRSKGLSKAGLGFCKKVGMIDSTLGEQFDKIENFVKGTDRESANLPQNFQNLQSPTANPRILGDNRGGFENSAQDSSPQAESLLQVVEKDGKQVLYVRKTQAGLESRQVLGEIVVAFIRSLHFGKSMRWGDAQEGSGSESFIRPIRNIMILLDSSAIDSALGSHSGDFVDFRATADHQSSSAPKSTKSTTSPTANPRILGDNRGDIEKSASSSLRDTAEAVARQSTQTSTQALESTFDNANAKTQKARSPQTFGQQSKAATLLHRSYTPKQQDLLESTFDNAAQEMCAKEAWVQITGLDDYLHKLKNGGVILSADERKQRILEQIQALESTFSLQVELDSALLAQIVAITEYPTALLGGFDERFLALPEEVIITSMKEHQKYFAVRKNGQLYNGFVVVANALCDEFSAIISGNERVLKARLSDAEFFYHNDCATPLAKEPLASIAYIDGLGSMLDKTNREEIIGAYLARLYEQDSQQITQAIAYSKADLLSEMVGEFPELQGIMGHYYALAQGLSHDIAQAIKEQYLPNGEDSALPSSKISAIVALSGKLESLLGLFSIGTIPSGSKDPFALRRAANGVVKIALEWNLAFDVKQILGDMARICAYDISQENLARLQEFIIERLESILDIPAQIFRSASRGTSADLCTIASNAKALESLLKRDDREALMAVFKRVANITKDIMGDSACGLESWIASSRCVDRQPSLISLRGSQNHDSSSTILESQNEGKKQAQGEKSASLSLRVLRQQGEVAASFFSKAESTNTQAILQSLDTSLLTPPESALYNKLLSLNLPALTHPQHKLDALFSLKEELEVFFASVLVNDEDPALRRNRKTLLYAIYAEFCTIGDLKELAI